MSEPAASDRVFVTGATGSGKTEYLKRYWFPKLPRLLIVDMTEEWATLPGALHTRGVKETTAAMKRVAGIPAWRIVADLDEEEVETLCAGLVPRGGTRSSYSTFVGGMAILLDEIDLVMTAGHAPTGIRSVFLRGRHAGLTALAATQRPGSVNKLVTSQSREIIIFSLFEPNDLDYLKRRVGKEKLDELMAHIRKPYHYAALRSGEMTLHPPVPLPK